MARLDLERVLETCVRSHADEVWLVTGKPPVLRFADGVRELATDPLTGAGVAAVAFSASPDHEAAYRDAGHVWFEYPYRDKGTFAVYVLRHGDSTLAVFARRSTARAEIRNP